MGVVSPLVQTYAQVTPYVTEAEFLATPTAQEVVDLVPGGSQAQQDQALRDAILQASNWADKMCSQILAATVDKTRGRYRINREGNVIVPLKFRPLLEIQAVSFGMTPSQMQALTDFSDVAPMEYGLVEIPILPTTLPFATSSTVTPLTIGSKPIVDVTYVNGWPNALTASASLVNANSLTVTSPVGIYPNAPLVVHDGVSTESIVVAGTYVPGNAVVPVTTPLIYAHIAGVSVGAMPPRVKAAVVLLTVALLQTRGNDAIVLDSMETPTKASGMAGAASANIKTAQDMLHNELERVK